MSDVEEQYDPKTHKSLLQAISNLQTTQHIRKATRGEIRNQHDEFQLVKRAKLSTDVPKSNLAVNDVVQVLKKTKKHLDTGKLLKNVQSTKKVLEKPLEKTAADRIRRTIAYENTKKTLARWDAVVAKNRSSETQVFPLQTETIYVDTSAHAKPFNSSLKSDLMLEMEASEAKLRALKREQMGDTTDEKELENEKQRLYKREMVRQELIAKRKELAYLKMRESQKSAKARLQNKIKSKKYHKLMKRQKIQEQMKQFELLQKTNPENEERFQFHDCRELATGFSEF
ncbi:U3 small nucleolar RNA-associated protein 14 homolog A-like [Teleopsis dalmanni]|uniref:U3 small nucleolar RNA-associated protein 14 homolog A-like n=1 Tax=Teleopsis dalmanni TaxID=139649 RepID=UPI0018CE0E57|nr:U3 small nucleolar RNA-associated protein 14 homolog A-like [Teleopsis dalmanni]